MSRRGLLLFLRFLSVERAALDLLGDNLIFRHQIRFWYEGGIHTCLVSLL